MDGWELDFPNEHLFSCLDMSNTQSSCFFDIDEFLFQTHSCNDALADIHGQAQACTHAHACSQLGPEKAHTHTCVHVHTQIMPNDNEARPTTSEPVDIKSKTRPLGNREAVRKYRERKKAKTASLEEEVVKLRALNQQLMRRLQDQSLLETEVSRLKSLLVDIKGRIGGEIGSFPFEKPAINTNNKNTNNDDLAETCVMSSL